MLRMTSLIATERTGDEFLLCVAAGLRVGVTVRFLDDSPHDDPAVQPSRFTYFPAVISIRALILVD